MKPSALLASAGLLLAITLPAAADHEFVRMSPGGLAATGFSITATREKNGIVSFQVVRDLSKSRWPGKTAYLTVQGDAAAVVECALEPQKRTNTLTYWFKIAPQYLPHSRLTVSEDQNDPTDPDTEKIIGGGTIYEFHLADFLLPGKGTVR